MHSGGRNRQHHLRNLLGEGSHFAPRCSRATLLPLSAQHAGRPLRHASATKNIPECVAVRLSAGSLRVLARGRNSHIYIYRESDIRRDIAGACAKWMYQGRSEAGMSALWTRFKHRMSIPWMPKLHSVLRVHWIPKVTGDVGICCPRVRYGFRFRWEPKRSSG